MPNSLGEAIDLLPETDWVSIIAGLIFGVIFLALGIWIPNRKAEKKQRMEAQIRAEFEEKTRRESEQATIQSFAPPPLPHGLITRSTDDYEDVATAVSERLANGSLVTLWGAGGVGKSTLAKDVAHRLYSCLLYTSPSPRDRTRSRMPSSA